PERDQTGDGQQVDERALELAQEDRPKRPLARLGQRVRANPLQDLARTRCVEPTLGMRPEEADRLVGAESIPVAALAPLTLISVRHTSRDSSRLQQKASPCAAPPSRSAKAKASYGALTFTSLSK